MLRAIRNARRLYLAAYFLHPGRILTALERAARLGRRVTVRLEGRPFGDVDGTLRRANLEAVARLRAAGADALLLDSTAANRPTLHIKAAVLDGVAYLDDRNFNDRNDTIVRDNGRRDVSALKAALADRPWPRGRTFWTNKGDALAGEARLLQTAAHARRVDVQSESFGASNAVYSALKRLASRGVRCRLIVASQIITPHELRALTILQACGVTVREGKTNEKMALVDGRKSWIGSSNATSAYYDADQKDWGLRTDARATARELEGQFVENWSAARPFKSS